MTGTKSTNSDGETVVNVRIPKTHILVIAAALGLGGWGVYRVETKEAPISGKPTGTEYTRLEVQMELALKRLDRIEAKLDRSN